MMTLKLLLYTHSWAPSVGGVESSTMLLAEGLADWSKTHEREEIAVTLVTQTPAGEMEDSRLPFRVIRRPGIWQLVGLIRSSHVVHLAGPVLLPLALGFLLRKPIVVEQHGYQAVCPNGLLFLLPAHRQCPGYFAMKRYERCIRCRSAEVGHVKSLLSLLLTFPRRWLCKKAAVNILITNHVGTRLRLPRSHTVYYGIRDPIVSNGKNEMPSASPPVVAYVGRLVSEKGLPLLLHAARSLKEHNVPFRLKFLGDGPERKRLERLADSFGLSDIVTFTGYLRGSQLADGIGEVTAVVMPSVWEETAGLSAIEHMMRGRVVIAADSGGLSEVVGDTGLKFAPGDSEALAACIRKVIEDPAVVASLGSAARVRAMRLFGRDSMIRSHMSLYRDVSRQRDWCHPSNVPDRH